MKLSLATLATAFGLASATTSEINAGSDSISSSSPMGRSLMSRARRLDGNKNNDISWVTNYSIKFEKCATSNDYYGGYFGGGGNNNNNNNNNRNGYNGMYEQRLVHFKLCPSDACGSSCDGPDYVIDMNEYVNAYMESKLTAQEYNCEKVKENCYCDDDAIDDDACQYQCYVNAGLDYCGDYNGNNGNNNNNQFDVQEALECARLEVDEDAMNYYQYQNGGYNQNYYNQNNNQKMEFFVGPYCSSNGKSIFLGVFMDEVCSFAAPDGIYAKLNYGNELPYAKKSIIDSDCLSCKEPQEYDENNDGDQEDADEVLEVCETLYQEAGKCESGMAATSDADGNYFYPNTYACDFIKGLKVSGKSRLAMPSVNVTPKVLAGVFAATTVLFAGIALSLHKKMSRSQVDLAVQGGELS